MIYHMKSRDGNNRVCTNSFTFFSPSRELAKGHAHKLTSYIGVYYVRLQFSVTGYKSGVGDIFRDHSVLRRERSKIL